MSERIRQLEDGLQLAHSAQSSQQHPLLSENLLSIKNGVLQQSRQQTPETIDSEQGPQSDILETFGTLRIGDDGSTRFLGPSAASEVIKTWSRCAFVNLCELSCSGAPFGTHTAHATRSSRVSDLSTF